MSTFAAITIAILIGLVFLVIVGLMALIHILAAVCVILFAIILFLLPPIQQAFLYVFNYAESLLLAAMPYVQHYWQMAWQYVEGLIK